VRLALGAPRTRLFRQLLAESGLLGLFGAAAGILLAHALSRLLVSLLNPGGSIDFDVVTRQGLSLQIVTDRRELIFVAAVSVLTCLIFGILPALRATRIEASTAMKGSAPGLAVGRSRFGLQRSMVVSQIAISLVLLAAALLFVRSFRNLVTLNPGVREHGISVVIADFHRSDISDEHAGEFRGQLLEEVRQAPGVIGAATTTTVPLHGDGPTQRVLVGQVEGQSEFTWVSPGYFDTMGIDLIQGRDFDRTDTAFNSRVAIVNQAFVREFLGDQDPLGKSMRTGAQANYPSSTYQIVGVLADTKSTDVRHEISPMVFAPSTPGPFQGPVAMIIVYSSTPVAATARNIRSLFAEKHPEIELITQDFEASIRDGMLLERLMAMLAGFFGILAGLLAAVGLYGVVSYIVARRKNEIGIRLALGSRPGQVVGMMMREAALMLVIGTILGLALALASGRAANSLLYGVTAYDPLMLGSAWALLAAIAALASFIPAIRAARLDPMEALRHE
jgi:predicted permease